MTEQRTDAERFEELFRSNYARVLAYALRRADPETADEVVADTFLVCWRRLDDVPANSLPWLLGVARRSLANRRRGDARRVALIGRLEASAARSGGPELDRGGDTPALAGAFAELSESDLETLRLIAWEHLSVPDAARVAGCSPPAFAVRLHRARRRLAANLSNPQPHVSAPTDSDDRIVPETAA